MPENQPDVLARREKAVSFTLDFFRDVGRDNVTAIPPNFLEMAALVDGFLSGAVALRYELLPPSSHEHEDDAHAPPDDAFIFLRALVGQDSSQEDSPFKDGHDHALKALNQSWEEKEKVWLREGQESLTRALTSFEEALQCERTRTTKQRRLTIGCVCIAVLTELITVLTLHGGLV